MARGRGVDLDEQREAVTLVPADDPEIPDQEDAAQDWENFEALRDMAEDQRKGMVLWIYRIATDTAGNPQTSAIGSALLFTAPLDAYSLNQIFERVKKEYMPRGFGRAMIRLMVRREGKAGVVYKQVFRIEKGINDDEPEAPGQGASSDIGAIANAFQKSLDAAMEQNRQMMASLINSMRAQPPVDQLAQTERMIAMVTGLAGILVNKSTGAAPVGSLSDSIGGFRELLKFAREMNDGRADDFDESEDQGIVGILNSLKPWAETFKTMIEKQSTAPGQPRQLAPSIMRPSSGAQPRTAPQASPQSSPNTTAPRAAAQPPSNLMVPSSKENVMLLKIVELTNDLITLKQGGGDPAAIGKTLVGMVTPEVESRLLDLLDADDWFERLAGFNPKVYEHREFFGRVRDAILAEYEPVAPEHPDTDDGAETAVAPDTSAQPS